MFTNAVIDVQWYKSARCRFVQLNANAQYQ